MDNLFYSRKFYDLANYISATLDTKIKALTKLDFEKSSVEQMTENLVEKNKIVIPKLLEDEIHMKKPEDVKISTEGRGGYNRTASTTIDGTKFTFVIPFEGDGALFKILPSTYLSTLPYGEISNNEINIVFKVPIGRDSSNLKVEFDRNLEKIKEYLGFLENDMKPFNNSLLPSISASIQARKDKLDKDDEAANSFGFPIR